jgi:PRC-barrel domain protein
MFGLTFTPRFRARGNPHPISRFTVLGLLYGEDGMRIGFGTAAAAIALALIAAGDVHGAGVGFDQAGKAAWPWRLTQQAEPSTPPGQPAAPLEQPAQEKAQEKSPPPAANAPPAAPPAGTPAVVLDDQEVSGIVGKSVRSSADEDMGRIVDVIVSQDGHIRAAIIDFGGFLGIGTRKIAVDWRGLKFWPAGKITVELTRNQVRVAPEYKRGEPLVVLGPAGPERTTPSIEAATPEK